ncbi:PP2C family protein-serine/threonine phosphatase [Streptomyces sp. SL13]|uniref:PP2C family protein-serine/threonine phosphatase n=1 Tax=Streptantibioticus silvisoli TaxID=2705255 RepID=A0AA90K810_9ACTN|nr:PP2C family protein-serine/threonine phosphatase [Streptantibioticus silvisoli]MDI5963661.1 PP2C family protein-serine/threonine phosphatase [Streptantibioticus silvisoli]MDI5969493.1 PP2C family protein-serine/threonine phosphatase [Streptantibioticus silvisoli]
MSATGRSTDRQSDPHSDGTPPSAVALPHQRTETPADDLPPEAGGGTADVTVPAAFTLLVVGDDPTGALGTPDLLDAAGNRVRIRRARNLTEAQRLLTDDVTCVLLDLHLPAPHGCDPATAALDTLRDLLRLAPATAVLALAHGEEAAELAAESVRVGAQDYLFRDALDASLLNRAMRYAVERKRADLAHLQLTETRLLAQENARLERGLLPTPLLDGVENLDFATRYRPGRSRALLGGDFYDVIRTPDGTVHAMIGDVCGHGPDEAALGVELRIAWRALIFAGLSGDPLLRTLQQVLECERPDDEIFATLSTVDIAPDGRHAVLWLAGHPAPLVLRGTGTGDVTVDMLPYEQGGPALGLLPEARWTPVPVRLGEPGEAWSLLLYTDGLIEGRTGEGNARLGTEGMTAIVERHLREGLGGEDLLDATLADARRLNGGELTDDVAVILLEHRATPTAH